MKCKHYRNDLLDAGDFNDVPRQLDNRVFICWFFAACFGALSVICTIIATQPVTHLMP